MSIEKIARDELRERIARTVFVEIWNDQPNVPYGPAFEHDRDLWERIADALLPLLSDNAFQAGAEAMREAAAKAVRDLALTFERQGNKALREKSGPAFDYGKSTGAIKSAEVIRSLPLPIQKEG